MSKRDYSCDYIETYLAEIEREEKQLQPGLGDEPGQLPASDPVEPSQLDKAFVGAGLKKGGELLEAKLGIDGVFTVDWLEEGEAKFAPLVAKYDLVNNIMPPWMQAIWDKWNMELEASFFIAVTAWNIREALAAKKKPVKKSQQQQEPEHAAAA